MIALGVLLLLATVPDSVRNEPPGEKRYLAALAYAVQSMVDGRIDDAVEGAEFALVSLEAMGKPPYKNAGNYKKAELRLRELLRRCDARIKEAGVDERPALEKAYERLTAVHEKLLQGVMSKKP
jgi:hypothetical protein